MNKVWTAADDEAMLALWRTGITFAQIGAKLGVTKNSIIGRTHRLHYPPRDKAMLAKARPRPPAPRPPAPPSLEAALWPPTPRTIGYLRSHHCRYPLWPDERYGGPRTPPDRQLYCGAQIVRSSWCALHAEICASKRKLDAMAA